MCLDNEVKPTEEEIQTITTGYKVFVKYDDRLLPIFRQSYGLVFNQKRWNHAQGLDRFPDSAGFHVFLDETSAKNYFEDVGFNYERLVIRKVKVKGIIGIGQIDENCAGSKRTSPHSVMRCQQVKIIPLDENKPTEVKQP